MSALSVLVLEDHPLQRAVITCLLQRCGVTRVFEAEEGEQALALLREGGGVDIAICDLRMSGMDGLEFLHHISREGMVRAVDDQQRGGHHLAQCRGCHGRHVGHHIPGRSWKALLPGQAPQPALQLSAPSTPL
ncbi:response regulator transcription factor [Aeromonas intestinalis]